MKDSTMVKKQTGQQQPATFGNVLDDIFHNSLRHFFDENFWDVEGSQTRSGVPVNIRETEEQYELDVVAPGCRKENFSISIEGNLLTVSYILSQENGESDRQQKWVRNEFIQRPFRRSFTLDDSVDVNNINATYSDGILHLSMAKNEKAKMLTRTIEVN